MADFSMAKFLSPRLPFQIAAAGLGLVAVLLLGLLAVGFFLPGQWEAEREEWITASADEVYAHLISAEGWSKWTPMPETGFELDGPEEGAGARWSWDDPGYGAGSFTVLDADPPRRVRYRVEVEGGSLSTEGVLLLEESGGRTRVHWREDGDFGRNPLLGYMAGRMGEAQSEQMERSLDRLRTLIEESRLEAS